MATWLYQITEKRWSPERYRVEIWEGEKWAWGCGSTSSMGQSPAPGDTVVFFYAPTGGKDPGFYGWAVILEWLKEDNSLYFRPAAPSDNLKMHPWWNTDAQALADSIRGPMKQKTMWLVSAELVGPLRVGINSWLATGGRIDRDKHRVD